MLPYAVTLNALLGQQLLLASAAAAAVSSNHLLFSVLFSLSFSLLLSSAIIIIIITMHPYFLRASRLNSVEMVDETGVAQFKIMGASGNPPSIL